MNRAIAVATGYMRL